MDPGETVDLTATLVNIGGAPLANLVTTLTTSDPRVTIQDNSGIFGAMAIDAVKENTSDPYVVTASASASQGQIVAFRIIASDAGFSDTIDFDLAIGVSAPSDTGYYYAYYSGGPHLESPAFNWFAIDSTQTANPGTSLNPFDNQTITVSLPFTFTYYGENYNQVSVSSNGWVAMGATLNADWTNSPIPNGDGPDAMIAGLWDDLDPGNSGMAGDVYTYYDASNHRFIVEYFRVEHYPSGYEENFEIILLDPAYYPTPTGDGEIIVQYLTAMQQGDNTIGIENPEQSFGIEYFRDEVYHNLAIPITDGFAIRYTTFEPGQTGVEEYTAPAVSAEKIFLQVTPNPFSKLTNIRYTIHDTRYMMENPALNIYDATGRLVRSFDLESCIMNHESTAVWSGDDSAGRKLPAGVYFVKLDAGTEKVTDKIILID